MGSGRLRLQVVPDVKRVDKGNRVVRYLTGHAAIPNLSYDGSTSRISAPFPYHFVVTTDAAHWRFMESVKGLPEDRVGAVVRYDAFVESIDAAVVGMRLDAYAQLLHAHYESMSDRLEN